MRVDWPGIYAATTVTGDLFEVKVSSFVPSLERSVETSFSLTRRELNEQNGLFDRRIAEAKRTIAKLIADALRDKTKLAPDL